MTPSLDLLSLHEDYRTGVRTPVDVVRSIYKRIASRGDDAVWIHVLPEAEAIARAESLGAFDPAKPLFGVPFAVKDNIDVAGLPTTAACPKFTYEANVTATLVERLLEAGAILIGKTNLDQFATGLVGVRSPYGAPSCVFDKKYIAGGSSSGSAVAVASGLVSFALGTDTAGSGRVPAAFNNIVGWKPTRGLLSTRGIVPACRSLDCPSVFALTSDDAQRISRVAAAFDAADEYSRHAPDPSPKFPETFRFGIPAEEDLCFFGDSDSSALFDQAIDRLISLGGVPVTIDFAPFRETAELLYSGSWVAERLTDLTPFLDEDPDAFHPVTRQIIEGGKRFTAVDAFRDFHRLEALRRKAGREWENIDLLLLPTTGTIYTHDEVATDPIALNTNLGYYTNFVNLLDLSGIAVPAGFRDNGLPFGITLLGKAFQDEALFILAARFQTSLGGRLGATDTTLESLPKQSLFSGYNLSQNDFEEISLAVVGAHLRGEPLNGQLLDLGARFERTTRTRGHYRLYAFPESSPPKPGLIRDPNSSGPGIEVEIWKLTPEAFGRLTASVRPPLSIGTLELEGGGQVHGFLCEACAVKEAEEITHFGGWRSFLART